MKLTFQKAIKSLQFLRKHAATITITEFTDDQRADIGLWVKTVQEHFEINRDITDRDIHANMRSPDTITIFVDGYDHPLDYNHATNSFREAGFFISKLEIL